jgi:acyl-CoA thioesterase II
MVEALGDFEQDTAVRGAGGRFTAHLSDAWSLWGPAGGYVSAIALRAAGAASRFGRPASYSCNYLGVAHFGPIDIEVATLRSAKRAEALRVSLIQDGAAFLDASVWTIDEDMKGLEHDVLPMPDVPGPDGLKSWHDVRAQDGNPYARFWSNIEERMILQWFGPWTERPLGEPMRDGWYRFKPRATFDDLYLDAARSLMIVDTMGWPAAMHAHEDDRSYIAPTIELSVRFHRLTPNSEWLYGRTEAPVATEGLMSATSFVWSQDGSLVASGGQSMLFRPAPG